MRVPGSNVRGRSVEYAGGGSGPVNLMEREILRYE